MIALCCPLCIETFHKNPTKYLAIRRAHEDNATLEHPGLASR